MSADSTRRGVHKGAQVVSPQPIVDRSIIDSVAGIINDIVPQAYAGAPNSDNKESITWARFEYADVNDPALYPDYNEGSSTPPLLLVLGYTTGVQVWLIAATGEATEVLSWRQGVVRTLRILPNPKTDDERIDLFEAKRPMVAICDSAGPGPQFCNISFISLKTGEQAKSIKFKNPVCDILANRRSIVVAFLEKIAVFDARTLEDILTVTTCYASPGPNPNPIALGTRWLAYCEKKLLPARRSSGGCEGEGVQSYTATVLYAAKSLGKGLRGLGETVASSLTGNSVSPLAVNNMGGDVTQPGVVTILDLQAATEEKEFDDGSIETIIAHFTAHTDAIVAMTFDLTGALLMTADKRGHDFHVFRIQPHPGGPTLAAVHHLYILHRGDTTAKVQDMTFSSDTRWAGVSTVRGTTHVFPVAPYGGPVGVRTHSTPHVVNRLSRFHRSAGLTDDGARSHSPVSHAELPLSVYPYSNPRLPPYPHPTILHPLAQIRQPSTLNHVNSQSQMRPQQRQRLHSDDSGTLPLKICACFAPPRAWIYAQRESSSKVAKRAVDSLFIMACHGNMIQYDLEPKPAAGVPKEKVCDDTMIELEVEAKGQWPLLRSPSSLEIVPPLQLSNPLLAVTTVPKSTEQLDSTEDRWLSQVEIVTHAGPHRRLWMGPQFVFKTYSTPSGVPVNLVEAEAVEIGVTGGSRPARSNPVNMPHATSRPLVPVVIDGSGSSYEQSPRFMEAYGDPLDGENMRVGSGENQLREDLAEAMLETSIAPNRVPGRRSVFERVGQPVAKVVNPLGTVITVSADEDDVSSSQEFDSAEEGLVPDPPRSVCAEEGPASLGDLEPESQALRDLTKICAEMRSASEPAIDSVTDENVREVKERKELCVEMAVTTSRSKAIDFEREESFRDVPTSLSLCAEQGEIPSSPMTQAKETAWCKRAAKRDDVEVRERNMAKAKYVVNYDEDCVVLMENRSTGDRKAVLASKEERAPTSKKENAKQTSARRGSDGEKAGKKSGKGCSAGESKRATEGRVREKYIVKEQDDSIVIEDTRCKEQKASGAKRKGSCSAVKAEETDRTECVKEESKGSKGSKDDSKGTMESKKNVEDFKDAKDSKEVVELNESVDNRKAEKRDVKPDESFVELEKFKEPSDILTVTTSSSKEGCKEKKESASAANECGTKDNLLAPLESPSLDDLNSMEYHMVEATCPCKDATSSNQSDEDIEHIQNSELTQMREQEYEQKFKDTTSCSESSPIAQRKSSKSTISDDDLEYIHSAELTESLDYPRAPSRSANTDKNEDNFRTVRRHSKHTLSSDDDLEHVQHSDICELEPMSSKTDEQPARKTNETSEQISKGKNSKKRKDIVVIESDTYEADVTVIVKPLEGWGAGKTSEKDLVEEVEKCVDSKEKFSKESSLSPARKPKLSRTAKNSSTTVSKRSQAGAIEIIDIDALQRAEMETAADTTLFPECKILSPRHETPGTRSKKSRRNKKPHLEGGQDNNTSTEAVQSSKVKMAELQEAAEELLVDSKWQEPKSPVVEISWSSIVKKKTSSSTDVEPRKEPDLEPLIEVEEKSEYDENKKCEDTRDDSRDSSCLPLEESASVEVQKTSSRKTSRNMAAAEENMDVSSLDVLSSVEGTDKWQTVEAGLNDPDKNGKLEDKRKRGREFSSKSASKQAESEGTASIPPEISSKENSPEREKRSDSEQEAVPEHSSSSDEQNVNAMPMDTEEDYPPRDVVERNVVNGTNSSIYASKKGNRSKKKKRR